MALEHPLRDNGVPRNLQAPHSPKVPAAKCREELARVTGTIHAKSHSV